MQDPKSKSKSSSQKMSLKSAFKTLGLSREASFDEINQAFKTKSSEIEKKFADRPDRLVAEADTLYTAYRIAYMSKEGADEDQLLPLTVTGSEGLLNQFGIPDVTCPNLNVQMQSQAHYKNGQLVKKESTKTESFINKDGKKETKVYENGKLIKHTIEGREVFRK